MPLLSVIEDYESFLSSKYLMASSKFLNSFINSSGQALSLCLGFSSSNEASFLYIYIFFSPTYIGHIICVAEIYFSNMMFVFEEQRKNR